MRLKRAFIAFQCETNLLVSDLRERAILQASVLMVVECVRRFRIEWCPVVIWCGGKRGDYEDGVAQRNGRQIVKC